LSLPAAPGNHHFAFCMKLAPLGTTYKWNHTVSVFS
jgi:hypothetical protein